MRLPKKPRPSVLPKYLPVGTVYVVEGRGAEHGRLRVSSRYVVMPGGKRIDLFGGAVRGRESQNSSGSQHGAPGTGMTKSAAKKFVVVAGTAM